MKPALRFLTLAAALALPIAGIAGTASPAVAQNGQNVQLAQHERLDRHPGLRRHLSHHVHQHLHQHGRHVRRDFTLRRCYLPRRWLYVQARRALHHIGYRTLRYRGYKQVRCNQVFMFTACRGHRQYRVSVRYAYGRYAGMIRRFSGFCRFYRGAPRYRGS